MKTFYAVLANSLAASLANTFIWFAATFWAYLETKSVIATSVMAGVYTVTVAFSGFFLGSLVDRYHKKTAMLLSSALSLLFYVVALAIYTSSGSGFTDATNPLLWVFIVLILFGAIAGNLRAIALSTLVTILIAEGRRDRANGMVGTANGVGFLVASIFSGLAIGFLGMAWVLAIGIAVAVLAIAHLLTLAIPETRIVHADASAHQIDIRGTVAAIGQVSGLFGLIFFSMFNNFLGGVFMSLMDPYGLELVSVQVWGALWGFLSLGFIVGGLLVARRGLGSSPLRTLFRTNLVLWTICIFFAIQPSIVLLTVGMFIWLCLMPVVEASEQTILQKVIVPERQGRVFGFAQSVEQAASPVTAFMIGPIAQFIFIPFMTDGAGADLIGGWFGTGTGRGIALLFIVAGLIGLVVTLLAMQSRSYRALSQLYETRAAEGELAEATA